jgi:hypothetical protein
MTNSLERKISPISDSKAAEIEQMPLLSTFLPYEFGGSTIENIEVTCASCGRELKPTTIRGAFTNVAKGHSANLEGYGVCYSCKTITPVVSNFQDAGVVIFKVSDGWRKSRWTNRKSGFIGKLSHVLLENWQKLLPALIALMVVIEWILIKTTK